jgi:hypothetical protein
MNLDDVKKALADIKGFAAARDHEVAHSLEDQLHLNVLVAIATDQADDPKMLAMQALESGNIEFARWYS